MFVLLLLLMLPCLLLLLLLLLLLRSTCRDGSEWLVAVALTGHGRRRSGEPHGW